MKRIAGLLALLALTTPALADDNRASHILTPAIATSVLGGPVTMGTPTPDTTMGQTWVSSVHYSLQGSKVSGGILIRHASSESEAQATFAQSKATFHGIEVKGLGYPAYRTAKPAQLDVLKGVNWVIVSAGTFTDPDLAAQEKLAKAILANVK